MRDLPFDEIVPMIQEVVDAGATAYVKWTCPGCGERCVSDIPNVITRDGYIHTERANGTKCDTLYTGQLFGLNLIGPPDVMLRLLQRRLHHH